MTLDTVFDLASLTKPIATGSNHHATTTSTAATAASTSTANAACGPCRRNASDHGVGRSSRAGDCHWIAQPASADTTNPPKIAV